MSKKTIILVLIAFLFSILFANTTLVFAAQSESATNNSENRKNTTDYSKKQSAEEDYYFDSNCTDAASALRVGYLVIKVVRVMIPIIIIIMGTISLFSSILSGGPEGFSKNIVKLLTQVALAALIFFTPSIVNSIMSVMTTEKNPDMEICRKCLFEDNCPVPEEDAWYDK